LSRYHISPDADFASTINPHLFSWRTCTISGSAKHQPTRHIIITGSAINLKVNFGYPMMVCAITRPALKLKYGIVVLNYYWRCG
jgi:hypothetical protein